MKKLVKKIIGMSLALYMTASLLPLAALAQEPSCGLGEHTHSDACRQQTLICGQEHEHDDACFETKLICTLEEHSHGDACHIKTEENSGESAEQDTGQNSPNKEPDGSEAEGGTYDEAALTEAFKMTKALVDKYVPGVELKDIRNAVSGFDRETIAALETEYSGLSARVDALGVRERAVYNADVMSGYLPSIAAGIGDARARFADEDARTPKPVPVAKVGSVDYLSLSEALNAAAVNGEITLLGDVKLDESLEIKRNVTIDLNSHGISGERGLISISEAALNIKNGKLGAAGESAAIRLTDGILNITDVNMGLTGKGVDASGTCIINVYNSSLTEDTTVISTLSLSGNSASLCNIYGGRIESLCADCTVRISEGSIGTLTIGENGTASITGGSFTQDVSRYVPAGYTAKSEGDGYIVVPGTTDDDKTNENETPSVEETVAAAVKAAEAENSTVEIVLAPSTESSADITAYVKTIADSGAELTLTVPVAAGKVTFDKNALKAISDKADADISLSVSALAADAIPEEVGLGEDAVVIEINLSGADVSEAEGGFGSGSATVTVSAPENITSPAVYYINGGEKTPVDCTLNEDGTISFTISHFSRYAILNAPTAPSTLTVTLGRGSNTEDADDKDDKENKKNKDDRETESGTDSRDGTRSGSGRTRVKRIFGKAVEAESVEEAPGALYINEVYCRTAPAEEQISSSSFYEKPEDLDSERRLTALSSTGGTELIPTKPAAKTTDDGARISALIVMSLSAACLAVGAMLFFTKRRNEM